MNRHLNNEGQERKIDQVNRRALTGGGRIKEGS
jgi:hypothetical protein